MEKVKKIDVILEKHYDGLKYGFKLEELPKDLLPTDIIQFEQIERYFGEDNGWDDHTILRVSREREETDAEFEARKERNEKSKERLRKQRYESYLKLKAEFDPTPSKNPELDPYNEENWE
jgi:hypothetical protein